MLGSDLGLLAKRGEGLGSNLRVVHVGEGLSVPEGEGLILDALLNVVRQIEHGEPSGNHALASPDRGGKLAL